VREIVIVRFDVYTTFIYNIMYNIMYMYMYVLIPRGLRVGTCILPQSIMALSFCD
jgi:hypothetical protein